MKAKLLVIFFLMSLSSFSQAIVEIRGDFWYNKQIFGVNTNTELENSAINKTYSASFAWYLWRLTGIEIYGTRSENIVTNNDPTAVSSNFTIISSQNVSITESIGIGLRQALWSKRYRIVPTISIGYAKQFLRGYTEYVVDDNGSVGRFKETRDKSVLKSGYVGLALRIRVTQTLGLTGSVRSIMEDFKTETFDNNLQYTAGLSLVF